MMKTITRITIICILSLLTYSQVNAQDFQFSQFYASPMILNPAMTGQVNGSGRVSTLFRTQYTTIAPYTTIAASYDMSVLGCGRGNNHVGLGVALHNDRSGDGEFNDLTALFSAAFHQGLDPEGKFMVSIAGQAAYTQKSIDFTKLLFASQIYNFEFDPSIANQEAIYNNRFSYLDYRAGALLTAAATDRVNFYAGGAYHHLSNPLEYFLDYGTDGAPEDAKLLSRMVIHGGGSVFLGKNLSISPSGLFMQQGTARQINAGAALGFHFAQNNRYRRESVGTGTGFYIGTWMRISGAMSDAIIFTLGMDYNDLKFGFAYDVNISPLKVATNGLGSAEISLTYNIATGNCSNRRDPLYCPRF